MYCLQQWYALADEALEDALYDSQALRDFVGVDLSRESVPDATTLLKFRHLLQTNDLTQALFGEINAHLGERGLLMRAGTIVDATIIAAPSSTKNAKGERDPEMHQTKKGNQWHFGLKAHIGVDAESGWCTRSPGRGRGDAGLRHDRPRCSAGGGGLHRRARLQPLRHGRQRDRDVANDKRTATSLALPAMRCRGLGEGEGSGRRCRAWVEHPIESSPRRKRGSRRTVRHNGEVRYAAAAGQTDRRINCTPVEAGPTWAPTTAASSPTSPACSSRSTSTSIAPGKAQEPEHNPD